MAELWKDGWQEDAFGRLKDFVRSSPAFYKNVSPSDVCEDAYLLAVASTLFLRDEDSGAKGGHVGAAQRPPKSPAGSSPGAPPFVYERCSRPGTDASSAFAAAAEGRFGAFHKEVARTAGSLEIWAAALSKLQGEGALHTGWPREDHPYSPPLATFNEDLKACMDSVLRKAVLAFKIGFGLWGRWESS